MLQIPNTATRSQSPVSEAVLQSGILLALRQKFFLPFEALLFIKTSFDEVSERKIEELQVL